MAMTISQDVRQRLDAHLDAVEQSLVRAGKSREERRAVTDDLEAQILDMLAAKIESPTLQDVEAVLAQLDPPSAYGAPGVAASRPAAVPPMPPPFVAPAPRPRYSRAAIWGLVCILVSFLPLLLVLPFGFFFARSVSAPPPQIHSQELLPPVMHRKPETFPAEAPPATSAVAPDRVEISPGGVRVESGGDRVVVTPGGVTVRSSGGEHVRVGAVAHRSGALKFWSCVALPVGPFGLLGTVLGWVAFFQIRASKGALRGTGMALFDGLFYPVAGLLLLLFTA